MLGEGCGGLDGGKCLESGTNSGRSADVWNIRQGSNVRKRIRICEREVVIDVVRSVCSSPCVRQTTQMQRTERDNSRQREIV